MKHRFIPLQDKDAWQAAIDRLPHSFAHTHWYNDAMQTASQREIVLYQAESEDFYAVCPLSLRRITPDDPYDITTPYGFSGFLTQGNATNFNAAWQTFMSEQGFVCGHIGFKSAITPAHFTSEKELFTGKNSFHLTISNPLDTIEKQFAEGHYYRLKQWQRENHEVIISKDTWYTQTFIDLYNAFLTRKNISKVYHFSQAAWEKLFNAKHTQLITILTNNIIAASAVFISYGDETDYFMAASTEAGRSHSTGLIYEGIKLAKANQCSTLNLGCGVRSGDSLEKFKARFGATAIPTYSLKQIYNHHTYQTLCKKYNSNPDEVSGYFPIYWSQVNA